MVAFDIKQKQRFASFNSQCRNKGKLLGPTSFTRSDAVCVNEGLELTVKALVQKTFFAEGAGSCSPMEHERYMVQNLS